MRIKSKLSVLGMALGAILSTQSYAVGNNPASTSYVDNTIESFVSQIAYQAGQGIVIDGNVILSAR